MDIEYYKTIKGNSDVKKWLDAWVQKSNAGDKDAQYMVKHFFYCIERMLDGMPFSRPLQKGVFELRPQNSVTKHRITYCYWQGKILLLSEFKKDSGPTPDDEIKLAVKRKNDWIERHWEQERERNRKGK
jgi:phage-related protein